MDSMRSKRIRKAPRLELPRIPWGTAVAMAALNVAIIVAIVGGCAWVIRWVFA